MVGEVGPARQAWCRWWNPNSGCGELMDLDDRVSIAVVSIDLQTGANVLPRLKYLHVGEFVEYRRVPREDGSAYAVLIRGIKGWPLMCEVKGQVSQLPATAASSESGAVSDTTVVDDTTVNGTANGSQVRMSQDPGAAAGTVVDAIGGVV